MQAARREHSQALEYDADLPTYDFPPGGSDGDTTAFEIKFTPTQNTMLGWVPSSLRKKSTRVSAGYWRAEARRPFRRA